MLLLCAEFELEVREVCRVKIFLMKFIVSFMRAHNANVRARLHSHTVATAAAAASLPGYNKSALLLHNFRWQYNNVPLPSYELLCQKARAARGSATRDTVAPPFSGVMKTCQQRWGSRRDGVGFARAILEEGASAAALWHGKAPASFSPTRTTRLLLFASMAAWHPRVWNLSFRPKKKHDQEKPSPRRRMRK